MGVPLEDFGRPLVLRPVPGPATEGAGDRYDEGYNAGWDDAMAHQEGLQTQIGEQLATRLSALDRTREEIRRDLVAALEPAFRDIFDKVLPRTAERAFLPCLVEEAADVLRDATEDVRILVTPEDVSPLEALLDRAGIGPDQATVAAEPALAMSQALIRWTGQERRIDFDAVLEGLDASLETFFATLDRGQDAAELKEAQNG